MGIKDRKLRESEEKKELRKKQILTSARKLFSTHSFSDVSMADIANDCEISKGTLYLYFKTREELIFHLIVDFFENKIHFPDMDSDNSGYADLENFIDYLKKEYLNDIQMKHLIAHFDYYFTESYPEELPIVQKYIEYIQKGIELLMSVISKGIEDKSIKPGIEIRKTASMILNLSGSFGFKTSVRRNIMLKIQNTDPKDQYFSLLDLILDSLRN